MFNDKCNKTTSGGLNVWNNIVFGYIFEKTLRHTGRFLQFSILQVCTHSLNACTELKIKVLR